MNDYISRQAAIIEMMDNDVDHAQGTDGREVVQILDDIPAADVVPVTRCRDCKQFRRWVNTDIDFCDLTESTVFGDDFCSRGERWEE